MYSDYTANLKNGKIEEVPGLPVSCELSSWTMQQVLPHPQLCWWFYHGIRATRSSEVHTSSECKRFGSKSPYCFKAEAVGPQHCFRCLFGDVQNSWSRNVAFYHVKGLSAWMSRVCNFQEFGYSANTVSVWELHLSTHSCLDVSNDEFAESGGE